MAKNKFIDLSGLSVFKSKIISMLDGKANTGHTHNYAGSSSAGGSATSAAKLDTSTAGAANKPVYFKDGKPTACTYEVNKTVPADAKFSDTNTWRSVQNNLTSTSTTDSLSAAQGKALNDKITELNSNLGVFKFITSTDGNFTKLLPNNNDMALIICTRLSLNAIYVFVAHNYSNNIIISDVIKSNGFAVNTNNIGTVAVTYSSSGFGLRCMAILYQ